MEESWNNSRLKKMIRKTNQCLNPHVAPHVRELVGLAHQHDQREQGLAGRAHEDEQREQALVWTVASCVEEHVDYVELAWSADSCSALGWLGRTYLLEAQRSTGTAWANTALSVRVSIANPLPNFSHHFL